MKAIVEDLLHNLVAAAHEEARVGMTVRIDVETRAILDNLSKRFGVSLNSLCSDLLHEGVFSLSKELADAMGKNKAERQRIYFDLLGLREDSEVPE